MRAVGSPSPDVPAGRTTTSPTVEAISAVKLRLRVSLKTRVPTTKATPSTIAKVLIRSRTLRPSRLLSAARNISPPPGRSSGPSPRGRARGRARGARRRSRPSARKTTRSVYDAATGSWVTITIVWPCSPALRRSRSSTSAPDWESRLPVGSSAKTMRGRPARARATATRCCCPPESWLGRWPRRSRIPTVSITASYHSRSGLRRAMDCGSRMFSSARQGGHQVEALEDEADLVAPQPGELLVLEPAELAVTDPDLARGGGVERRAAVHQRGLARTRSDP